MFPQFDVLVAVINMLFVTAFIGGVAVFTHRWSHKDLGQEAIPCQNHGGYWADLLVLSPVFGLIAPCRIGIWWPGAVASLVITIGCHLLWAGNEYMPCHFIKKSNRFWQRLRTPGTATNVIYMFVAITAILSFYQSPGYEVAKFWVSVLLGLFYVPIGVLQPNWYYHRRRREASDAYFQTTTSEDDDEQQMYEYEYHLARAERPEWKLFDGTTIFITVVLELLIVLANFIR